MSSKWGRYPTPRLSPAICKSFAGSCNDPFPLSEPNELWAFVETVYLWPDNPIRGAGYARLKKHPTVLRWDGFSAPADVIVSASVRWAGWDHPLEWYLNTTLHYHYEPPFHHVFGKHFVDPRYEFKIGPINHIWWPEYEYYRVRILT